MSRFDVVYFLKQTDENEELRYSLRSLDENWRTVYRKVVFYGGRPKGITPDLHIKIKQTGLNKWQKVRGMIISACKDDRLTECFWLFNDDFFILKPIVEPTQFNGELLSYAEAIERKNGKLSAYTNMIRIADKKYKDNGLDTYNYEIHKPMLINRANALEVLEKYPDLPAFRSLYGNYWKIGGDCCHDVKIKVLDYKKIATIDEEWASVSTDDESFKNGDVGEYVRNKFPNESRFERRQNG